MKKLAVVLLAGAEVDPDGDAARQAVNEAAGRVASEWTQPEFVGRGAPMEALPVSEGATVFRYECMAVPRV